MKPRTVKNHLALLSLVGIMTVSTGQEPELREQAAHTLERAVKFFRTQVAVEGTYLWQYSADLSKREGEGKATKTQGWIQPPGTPSVGEAFLSAHEATGETKYLDAARETAYGLIRGQLRSGGWYYRVNFSPSERGKLAYRNEGVNAKARNVTTLDDDTTQAALRFLMHTDKALRFEDEKIRESVAFALTSLVKAQYPNGAWPQGYDHFPDAEKFPVIKASYPESWSRTWPGSGRYWFRYILNDNSLSTFTDTLFEANRIYGNPSSGSKFNQLAKESRAAAERAGEFLILAQMPEPQPAWAQQYNFEMHPSWARKFEPASVTGGESQGVMRTLLKVYQETGNSKYLEPIPRALDYFRSSRLPDGRLARFYELRSNRPLYFTKDYQLTYDDSDMPTHYSFKISDGLEAIAREYERLKNLPVTELRTSVSRPRPEVNGILEFRVRSIINELDARGAWVEDGRLRYHGADDPTSRVIRCATFSRNVQILSQYLEARNSSP